MRFVSADRQPQFIAGPGHNPFGGAAEIVKSIAHWKFVARLQDQAKANPTIVSILTAQARLELLTR